MTITAEHGCNLGYPGTDHTRERVPLIVYESEIQVGVKLGTRNSYGNLAVILKENYMGKVFGRTSERNDADDKKSISI